MRPSTEKTTAASDSEDSPARLNQDPPEAAMSTAKVVLLISTVTMANVFNVRYPRAFVYVRLKFSGA
jgi:hypothetical protein